MYEAFNSFIQSVIATLANPDSLSSPDLFKEMERLPHFNDLPCAQHRIFLDKLKSASAELLTLKMRSQSLAEEKSRFSQDLEPESQQLGDLVAAIEVLGKIIPCLKNEVRDNWAQISRIVNQYSLEHTVFEHDITAAGMALTKQVELADAALQRCGFFEQAKGSNGNKLSFYNALDLHQPAILQLLRKYQKFLKSSSDERYLEDYLAAQIDIIDPDVQALNRLQEQINQEKITGDELTVIYTAIEQLALKHSQSKTKVTDKNATKIASNLLQKLEKLSQGYKSDLQQLIDKIGAIKLKASEQQITIAAFAANEIKLKIQQCEAFQDFYIRLTKAVSSFKEVCETFKKKVKELQDNEKELAAKVQSRKSLTAQTEQRLADLGRLDSQERANKQAIESKKREILHLRQLLQTLGPVAEPTPPAPEKPPAPAVMPPKPEPKPAPKPMEESAEVIKLREHYSLILKQPHAEPYFGTWFQAYFEQMIGLTKENSEEHFHRCCHLLYDICFELTYGIATESATQFTVLNTYFDGYHEDNIPERLNTLLRLKPNLPLPETFNLPANSDYARQIKKLMNRGYKKEAGLFQQIVHLLQTLEKTPAEKRATCLSQSLLTDPRYDCLKQHRGSAIYRLWEWLAAKLKQLLGTEPAEAKRVQTYSARFYPSTASYKLIKSLERQVSPSA